MGELAIRYHAFTSGTDIVFMPVVFGVMIIGIVAGMVIGLLPGSGGNIAKRMCYATTVSSDPDKDSERNTPSIILERQNDWSITAKIFIIEIVFARLMSTNPPTGYIND